MKYIYYDTYRDEANVKAWIEERRIYLASISDKALEEKKLRKKLKSLRLTTNQDKCIKKLIFLTTKNPFDEYNLFEPWAWMEWDCETAFPIPEQYFGTFLEYKPYNDILNPFPKNLDRLIFSIDHKIMEYLEFIGSPYKIEDITDLTHFCGLDFHRENGEKLNFSTCYIDYYGTARDGYTLIINKKLNNKGDLFAEAIYKEKLQSILDTVFPDEEINKEGYVCSKRLHIRKKS